LNAIANAAAARQAGAPVNHSLTMFIESLLTIATSLADGCRQGIR